MSYHYINYYRIEIDISENIIVLNLIILILKLLLKKFYLGKLLLRYSSVSIIIFSAQSESNFALNIAPICHLSPKHCAVHQRAYKHPVRI